MLKPKSRQTRRHWESLTDDQLIEAELMTDDPEGLENLVYEIPPGDEEPYVEFKYDLRLSGREEFRCVHGNHRHLAGFVMKKAGKRFLVGWMCGKTVYGEDFDAYTADFDAAVSRQDALRRVRAIRRAVDPFVVWLGEVSASEVFKQYGRVRGQIRETMPWVYDNLSAASVLNVRDIGAQLPANLCDDGVNAREDFNRLMTDVAAVSLLLAGEPERVAKQIGLIRSRMDGLAKRAEAILDLLQEVVDFFQPAVLAAVCKLANEHDNPRRRKYNFGLLTITCKRDRDKTTIAMPKNFVLPSQEPIRNLKLALSGAQD
jgi:hypothetical protein